jgi:hypothetical protein
MLSVISYFWQDPARQRSCQFTADDVRAWDRMVGRHLTVPHRRICITHRPDLIDFMETAPLDMTKHVPSTCLVKLMHWRPNIARVLGERILCMDIDCVVTASLNPLVKRDEDVVLWRNPNFAEGGRRGFYQGSMQLLTAGARPFLWADMDPKSAPAMLNRRFGGAEQAWISERLNTRWPSQGWEWNEAYWTEADGVYGAGRLFNGQMGEGVTTELPENARVVFFPGDRAPSQDTVKAAHPWIAPHLELVA